MRNDEWKEFANCRGKDTNMFFDHYETSGKVQLEVDKMCSECVVRTQCLDWAIEEGMEGGVFGRKYFDQNPKKRGKIREKV